MNASQSDFVTTDRSTIGRGSTSIRTLAPPPPARSLTRGSPPRATHTPIDPEILRGKLLVLLEHYRDVLEGIPSRDVPTPADDTLALMCESWNHPSYQRLERLLVVMHEGQPRLRQALRLRYERYSERRVAFCDACSATEVASQVGSSHVRSTVAGKKLYCRVRGHTVTLRPKVVRVLPRNDDSKAVAAALEWLARNWGSDTLVIPEPISRIEAERSLREAA